LLGNLTQNKSLYLKTLAEKPDFTRFFSLLQSMNIFYFAQKKEPQIGSFFG